MAAAPHWRKSSYSGVNEDCVEVADDRDHRHVRDSKLGTTSPTLTFTTAQWRAFTNPRH